MFEKYTEEARRVIFFARYEASQFGASEIKSEHLLMGLIREDKELINKVFKGSENLIDLDYVHKEVEMGTGKLKEAIDDTYDLQLSLELKKILACASKERERLESEYLSTEHLLLGILGIEETCVASEILRGEGLSFDSVRDRVEHSIKDELINDSVVEQVSDIKDKFENVGMFRGIKKELLVSVVGLLIIALILYILVPTKAELDVFEEKYTLYPLGIYILGTVLVQCLFFEANTLKVKVLSLLMQILMVVGIVSFNYCGELWQSGLVNSLGLLWIWAAVWIPFYLCYRVLIPILEKVNNENVLE